MWDHSLRMPFIDSYCAEHGSEELFEEFFDAQYNLKQDAPEELRKEVAMIRGEAEIPDEFWDSEQIGHPKKGRF